ncbi:MAG: M23 family metallopeptidase [Bacteroidota bacterium]
MKKALLLFILIICNSIAYSQYIETDSLDIEPDSSIIDNADSSLIDLEDSAELEGMVTDDFIENDSMAQAFIFWIFPTYKSDIPAQNIYFIWDNDRINPYNFSPANFKDSVVLQLINPAKFENFAPPITTYKTSDFGPRWHRYHYGVDLGLNVGDSIHCAFDGVVRIVKVSSGYGNVVLIRHDNGLETVYGHLSRPLVFPNQEVKAGETIALGGNTGRSTGPHLHFETRYLGIPINPNELVDFTTFTLKSDSLTITTKSFKAYRDKHSVGGRSSKYYTIRNGDTLGYIASKNHTTVKAICRLNRISQKKVLRAGARIKVR